MPATPRSWDRRYGVGPVHAPERQHRRYTEVDFARLETMRRLLLQGVSTAEAARAVRADHVPGHRAAIPVPPTSDRPRQLLPADVTVRQLQEAALRIDADRVVTLLARAVEAHGVTPSRRRCCVRR